MKMAPATHVGGAIKLFTSTLMMGVVSFLFNVFFCLAPYTMVKEIGCQNGQSNQREGQ